MCGSTVGLLLGWLQGSACVVARSSRTGRHRCRYSTCQPMVMMTLWGPSDATVVRVALRCRWQKLLADFWSEKKCVYDISKVRASSYSHTRTSAVQNLR